MKEPKLTISKSKIQELMSHIIIHLRCACGCTLTESQKESCMCGWVAVSDWFEDNLDMDFKFHKKAIDDYFKEWKKDMDDYKKNINNKEYIKNGSRNNK